MAQNPDQKKWSRLLVPWFGLGAATGFLLWIIFSGAGELQQVPVGLRRYLFFLPAGLAAAGVVCALLWFGGVWNVTARLSTVFCLFYFGFLKVVGWDFVPWALVVVVVIAFTRSKDLAVGTRCSQLLLHAMGSIAGLYMAFHLGDFLQPWDSFREVVRSLWLLASG